MMGMLSSGCWKVLVDSLGQDSSRRYEGCTLSMAACVVCNGGEGLLGESVFGPTAEANDAVAVWAQFEEQSFVVFQLYCYYPEIKKMSSRLMPRNRWPVRVLYLYVVPGVRCDANG